MYRPARQGRRGRCGRAVRQLAAPRHRHLAGGTAQGRDCGRLFALCTSRMKAIRGESSAQKRRTRGAGLCRFWSRERLFVGCEAGPWRVGLRRVGGTGLVAHGKSERGG